MAAEALLGLSTENSYFLIFLLHCLERSLWVRPILKHRFTFLILEGRISAYCNRLQFSLFSHLSLSLIRSVLIYGYGSSSYNPVLLSVVVHIIQSLAFVCLFIFETEFPMLTSILESWSFRFLST